MLKMKATLNQRESVAGLGAGISLHTTFTRCYLLRHYTGVIRHRVTYDCESLCRIQGRSMSWTESRVRFDAQLDWNDIWGKKHIEAGMSGAKKKGEAV